MYNKLISVIVPVFNVENYLHRCLRSILNNTYKNIEVICINDGSTDNSLEILIDYQKIDERIIILNQDNKGIAATRNRGLNAAHGEYISFIDSDDWIHNRFFELLLHFCLTNKTDIAMCGFQETEAEQIIDSEIDPASLSSKVIKGNDVVLNQYTRSGYLWNCLFEKRLLGGITFPNLQIEDIPFKIQVYAKGKGLISISLIDAQLYYYFQRDNSSIRSRNAGSRLSVYQYLLKQFDQEQNRDSKRIYLLYLSKVLLLYRYNMMYEFTDSLRKEVNHIERKCAKSLLKSECGIPWKYRLPHILLLCNPGLYRLFRIVTDPSMLQHEKQMKKGITQTWNRYKSKEH